MSSATWDIPENYQSREVHPMLNSVVLVIFSVTADMAKQDGSRLTETHDLKEITKKIRNCKQSAIQQAFWSYQSLSYTL